MHGYLLDLDGVVYRGDEPIRGAIDTIFTLRAAGHRVVFVTNNSTRSRKGFVEKLRGLGLPAREGELVNSAYATACYLRRRFGPSRIYCIGEGGLVEELAAAGHTVLDTAATEHIQPELVVIGMDRGFTYEKCAVGMRAIRHGARYIATNGDKTFPAAGGELKPGAGSQVAALTAAAGVEPFVIGKPNAPIMDIAYDILGLPPERCTMIGDRLETDIAAGKATGARTVLVLSGVTPRRSARSEYDPVPDEVIESLAALEIG